MLLKITEAMKKIVLIEDDTDLFSLLKYNLEKEGFAMTGLQTGKGAIELCRQVRPDLVLLDIMLPDSDGLDICKGIRKDPDLASVPVIFLTARASETDRIVGLELGANDYVVTPFFVRELIARIKLQFRNQAAPVRVLEAGGVELDRTSCQVRLNGAPLALTAHEIRSGAILSGSGGTEHQTAGALPQPADSTAGSHHLDKREEKTGSATQTIQDRP